MKVNLINYSVYLQTDLNSFCTLLSSTLCYSNTLNLDKCHGISFLSSHLPLIFPLYIFLNDLSLYLTSKLFDFFLSY